MALDSGVQANGKFAGYSPKAKAITRAANVPNKVPNNAGSAGAIRRGVTQSPPRPPAAPPAPGGGGGGGGSFFGGGGGGGAAFAAPAMPSETDWLAGDSGYQAQLAALLKALENTNADFDKNLQSYNVDYTTALGSLGWGDTDPLMEGDQLGWLEKDLNTSVGRGRDAVTNDFSGRGMLQSQHYARALDNLMRSLNDQKTSMDTGRQRFVDDIAAKRSAYADENKAAQGSARAEALARRAMSFMSV